VSYLLRGLPENLTAEERLGLQAAVPKELVIYRETNSDVYSQDQVAAKSTSHKGSGFLYRLVAMMTLQLFVFLSIVLPYVQLFAKSAYQFERQNHISERLFKQSISTADILGRLAIYAAHGIRKFNNGRVGDALDNAITWWVQGLSSGVYDGVGEGMEILGLRTMDKGKGPQMNAMW